MTVYNQGPFQEQPLPWGPFLWPTVYVLSLCSLALTSEDLPLPTGTFQLRSECPEPPWHWALLLVPGRCPLRLCLYSVCSDQSLQEAWQYREYTGCTWAFLLGFCFPSRKQAVLSCVLRVMRRPLEFQRPAWCWRSWLFAQTLLVSSHAFSPYA